MDFNVIGNAKKNKENAAPFQIYSYTSYDHIKGANWNFAVKEGEELDYYWDLRAINDSQYNFKVHGPNGFYRSFVGKKEPLPVTIKVIPQENLSVLVTFFNKGRKTEQFLIEDKIYLKRTIPVIIEPQKEVTIQLDYNAFKGWYDIEITTSLDIDFSYQFAGHLEDGNVSITDPYMASLSKV
ncbi:phospholipase domain-containing protein [Myroides injenensis]|nr:phospholipase domain-containing protein [Myroides injenensis]